MTRIEVYRNEDASAMGREYLALLQGLERSPKGSVVVSSCMYFYGTSPDEAKAKADSFVADEIKKAADAEKRYADLAARRRTA